MSAHPDAAAPTSVRPVPALRRRSVGVCVLIVLGLLVSVPGAVLSPAAAYESTHTLMQGSAAPMGQTNGTVWSTQIAGGKIFVGGSFTSTRPSGASEGSQETQQGYLAAFDASTGEPVATFKPQLANDWSNSAPIVRTMAVSPDGTTLYVGGDFNTIDGKRAEHVAAFDAATGAFKGQVGWNGVNGYVNALAVSRDGNTLYAGGSFNRANWVQRDNLAAFNLTDGSLRDWQPRVAARVGSEALRVVALAVSSDDSRVFIAGPFTQINGVTRQGFGAVSATSGATDPAFSGPYLAAPYSWGTSLAVSEGTVYVGGRDDLSGSSSRTEGVFSIDDTTGVKRWYANCYGDTFGVLPVGDDVYVASHSHDCAPNGGFGSTSPTTYLAIHAVSKTTGRERPYFVQTNGVAARPETLMLSRTLASDGQQLVMGGGYLSVNGKDQANLTRFKVGSAPPERAPWPSVRSCFGCRYVDLTILKAADRDDTTMTYEIYRDWDTTSPIARITSDSLPFQNSTFTFRDSGVASGRQLYYRVKATDAAGNQVWSVRSATVTVGSSGTSSTDNTGGSTALRTESTSSPDSSLSSAQREAARDARAAGLKPLGPQGAKRPVAQTPAPVLDDPKVSPFRQ